MHTYVHTYIHTYTHIHTYKFYKNNRSPLHFLNKKIPTSRVPEAENTSLLNHKKVAIQDKKTHKKNGFALQWMLRLRSVLLIQKHNSIRTICYPQ